MSVAAPAGFPTAGDLVAGSAWIAERPGLGEAARAWLRELPPERRAQRRRARALATPALHPEGFWRIGAVSGLAAWQAIQWAALDVPRGRYRSVVHGERDRAAAHAEAIGRARDLVRLSGPATVKLGQLIATARGLLPDEVVAAFEWCRDEVPAVGWLVTRERIERHLGRPLDELFAEIEEVPLAAASIAQVHGARLHDGTDVVVKVQRPGLKRQFRADIRAMALLAAALERRLEGARAANARGFVELFATLVLDELDFRQEALSMVEIGLAGERAGLDHVRVPRPIPDLVTRKVLVMERLSGVRYNDVDAIVEAGVDTKALIRLAIVGVLENTLVDGVFHGDLHAGNVLVDVTDGDHPVFGLVDYGIVGRLEPHQREALVRFMVGFAAGDERTQLDAMVEFGAIDADHVDAVVAMVADLQESGSRPQSLSVDELAEALAAVMRVLVQHGFRLPSELVLFFKNLLYLSGSAATLAPDLDLLGEIGPVFAHFESRYAAQMSAITERTT